MAAGADTIAALAAPRGAGRRAIVRVSGVRARELVRATCGAPPPAERSWTAVEFDDARGSQPGFLAWMPGPRSLTGEDVAEFHLPGNPHLAAAALRRLVALGARPALPGEFTRRAFLAGKLELSRAEGVLRLVEAEDRAEQRAASRLLAGGVAAHVEAARAALLELRALCEASLDFDESETGHVPAAELEACLGAATAEVERARRESALRPAEAGFARVVLVGAPNAGKSRLFNALAGGEHALVSSEAGTTRDPLRARVGTGAAAFELEDTAGVAPALTTPESGAQAATGRAARGADLGLWVVDAAAELGPARAALAVLAPEQPVYLAWNKLDLAAARPAPPAEWLAEPRLVGWRGVSAQSGAGLAELAAELARRVRGGVARELAARHAAGLEAAAAALEEACAAWRERAALELIAARTRAASEALDELCGRTTAEDVLDRLFARFCIGK